MSNPSSFRVPRVFSAGAMIAGLAFGAAPALAQEVQPPLASNTDASEPAQTLTKGEKKLAKLLEGRVAGEPQTCIRTIPTGRMTTIDKTAYVYGRGNTIYVQRTHNPEQIDRRDVLVTRRFGGGTQLCKVDMTTTIDPLNGFLTGAVFFDDFVPYTRVDENAG